ncbi:hypothetical protein SO802_032445 [Lithocarpus litseifolius]|uniref:Uncharacterized protein n=1 Tax=Lithocarpus litseifolius TaxID=425828 RepID=A0AAW2BFP6_9ROSI
MDFYTSNDNFLLLGSRVAVAVSTTDEKKAWLILAWVSTVAGNLSLLGSAANIIVCEQAHRAPQLGYTLSFWSHLKFGVPSTLIVTAIDSPQKGWGGTPSARLMVGSKVKNPETVLLLYPELITLSAP